MAAHAEPDLAVRTTGLGKRYEIFRRPHHRLLQQFFPSRHLGKPFWALRDVSIDIRRGETVGIIGRNGSGKSTLLQLICGTLTPSEGDVQVNGRVSALLELGAGFNPEFTGIENVFLNASILGLTTAQIEERMAAILDFAEIGDFVHQPVKTYSSGMFLRLAFAVAAHVDADILVVDEALAVGDALFVQKCMRFIERFKATGTVIFVSHNSAMVTSLCDRAVWLDRGRTRQAGDAKTVTEAFLEHLYAEQQHTHGAPQGAAGRKTPTAERTGELPADMRRDLLLHSNLRNDLEVFEFAPEEDGFGAGGAEILDVSLRHVDGRRLNWVVGGERVTLRVRFVARHDLEDVIVGFMWKNRFGQVLFGENTVLTHRGPAARVARDGIGTAEFAFRLPFLPPGDYVVAASIAEGTQHEHVQHHWLHDALALRCQTSHTVHGLVGIPVSDIRLIVEAPGEENGEPAGERT